MRKLLVCAIFIFLYLFSAASANAQNSQNITFEECAKAQNWTGLTNNCSKHVLDVYSCLINGRDGKKIALSEWRRNEDDVVDTICSNLPSTPVGGTCNQCGGGTSNLYRVEIEGRTMSYPDVFRYAYKQPHVPPTPTLPGVPTPTPSPTPVIGEKYPNATYSVETCFEIARRSWVSNPVCENVYSDLSSCMNLSDPGKIYYIDPFWKSAQQNNWNKLSFLTEIQTRLDDAAIQCIVASDSKIVEDVTTAFGLVQGNVATDPEGYERFDPSDFDFAKNIAGNCGYEGGACCDPELTSLLNNSPNLIQGLGIVDRIINSIKGLFISGAKDIVNEVNTVIGEKVLCKGNLETELTKKDGTKIFALNRYDSENMTYQIKSRDCIAEMNSSQSSDTVAIAEAYKSCLASQNENETISRSELAEKNFCDCYDPENTSDAQTTGNLDNIEHTSSLIYSQICADNQACLTCLKDGGFYQDFAPVRCKTSDQIDAADADLESEIGKTQGMEENRNAIARISRQTNVLGVSLNTCGFITDLNQRQLCQQCELSKGFWNIAGCTRLALKIDNSLGLCKNIKDVDERDQCRICAESGQFWSAIGCVSYDIPSIITNQIFGIGLGIAGTVALGCIMYAGILMQTSAGDPEKVSKSQELMTSCITGLIVIIFSILIIRVLGVDILRIPGFS